MGSAEFAAWLDASSERDQTSGCFVLGEDVSCVSGINDLLNDASVQAVSLEPELLGPSRLLAAIREVEVHGKACHMHGRSIVLGTQIAAGFPDVVQWVEVHLAFASERLVGLAHVDDEPREAAQRRIEGSGIGLKPEFSGGSSSYATPI